MKSDHPLKRHGKPKWQSVKLRTRIYAYMVIKIEFWLSVNSERDLETEIQRRL